MSFICDSDSGRWKGTVERTARACGDNAVQPFQGWHERGSPIPRGSHPGLICSTPFGVALQEVSGIDIESERVALRSCCTSLGDDAEGVE